MYNRAVARDSEPKVSGSVGQESAGKANRRIGRIMHDERGNGFVKWEPAPEGYVREPLEIVNETTGFDPYNSSNK